MIGRCARRWKWTRTSRAETLTLAAGSIDEVAADVTGLRVGVAACALANMRYRPLAITSAAISKCTLSPTVEDKASMWRSPRTSAGRRCRKGAPRPPSFIGDDRRVTVTFAAVVMAVMPQPGQVGLDSQSLAKSLPTASTSSTSASASARVLLGLMKQGRMANRPSTRVDEVTVRPRARMPPRIASLRASKRSSSLQPEGR